MRVRFNIKKKSAKFQRAYRSLVTLIMVLAAVFSITYIVLLDGNIIIRFALAIIVLMVSGRIIATANGLKNSFGIYLLGSRRGIKFIESVSKKHVNFWKFISDWGLVMGFGALSFVFFRKQVSKKMVALGLVSIVVILICVYPYLALVLNFINIPNAVVGAATGVTSDAMCPTIPGVNLIYYVFIASTLLGGFGVSTIVLIAYYGGAAIFGVLNPCIRKSLPPGVLPALPGITIPLFEGLISLFIILAVHEFSHGVLAKIAKIKIKSTGVVLFGIIPIGAFVEPEEKDISKLKIKDQDRISIAGISANMLTSLLFFIITLILLSYVLPSISTMGVLVAATVQNTPAYNVIPQNSIILKWNGFAITNSYDLSKAEANYVTGSFVNITTNTGVYRLMPTQGGKLGVVVAPAATTLTYSVTNFVFAVAVLSFALNFFVAIFNLLPLPAFDGWRIYKNKIKSKRVLNALAAIVIIAILLNMVPWFWILY